MEVILLERIAKLGQMGEVVKVKAGYARNYLLPRKKALRATDENKKLFETRRAQLEAQNLARKSDADRVAEKMKGLAVVLIRQAGEAGQLYGSVNARDIAAAVKDAGFTVERQQVELNVPIKALGLVQVPVHLHPEVAVTITVNVARSAEEAQIQARTGTAVVYGAQAEDEKLAREEARQRAEALFEEGAGPKDEEPGAEGAAKAEAAEPAKAEAESTPKAKSKKSKKAE
ncbi:MAG: 50S ribosomal protein L9 [Alphaproteobacteria bacterium]|nr:50S ribosomal protein L9 [Alphaproteobacteria bacterium]MBM3733637.1 50S ribosomal protein L9 [Acidimicrobiia bacterium]